MKTESPELKVVVEKLNERNSEIELNKKPTAEEIIKELEEIKNG